MDTLTDATPDRAGLIRRYTLLFAGAAVVLAFLPTLFALVTAPPNTLYLGHQTNVDDHMVYAAWMRQAMEGRILFDNRFTTDPQPGLTFHVYFLLLGWVAKVTGIVGAVTLARVCFSFLFVWLLGRWLEASNVSTFVAKSALTLASLGGGVGFMVFTFFGQEITDKSSPVGALTGGWLPIDVWQPEAFVFPSMLTNSLFMVSLCLIVVVVRAVIEARDSMRPVLGGALAFAALMNIHSYDVLLVTLVLVGFLAAALAAKRFSRAWAGRAALIGLGAVPSALWFLYVLAKDPVFQARANTLTYSPTLQQVVVGILPLVILVVLGLAFNRDDGRNRLRAGALALFVLVLHQWANGADPGKMFAGPVQFGVAFAVACGLVAFMAGDDDFQNFLWAWALVGLVAPYFPALFQRKLLMGLAVPWGLLAAVQAGRCLERMERSHRNILAGATLLVCSLTSLMWLQREVWFVRNDVASTTRHSVYYSPDVVEIIRRLNERTGRTVVVAPSGIPSPSDVPGRFNKPLRNDLNAILSGMTGAYTVAGHWSETPSYLDRLKDVNTIYSSRAPVELKREIIAKYKVDFAVVPVVPGVSIAPFDQLGEVVYLGTHWGLVRLAAGR
ncbi:MAG: hypothetical protein KF857_13000 [Fimbriimonadaceae bacterium]|nr:hypothetical protein [Fimbriimonadaceae bacterium]